MIRFQDIFGQESAIESLRVAHQSDRLPHGLIFAGPEGVGKATTAAALGALFLCEKPGDGDACSRCPSCRAIEAGVHPDFHVVTKELARLYDKSGTSKATQLSISVIRREVEDRASLKTAMGRGKVFVIEQAELMTAAAQNGLLKTLEEPAGRSLIVLLTTHAGDLLPTVRSRCQTIRFASLPTQLVIKELESRKIDRATAASAADFADGSLGVALRWIEDGVLASAGAVSASVDAILAGKDSSELAGLLRKGADAFAEKALERDELASKDSAVRAGLATYLGIAARRIRVRMRQQSDLNRACDAIEAISRAEKYLDANVNIPLVLEQLSATFTGPPT